MACSRKCSLMGSTFVRSDNSAAGWFGLIEARSDGVVNLL